MKFSHFLALGLSFVALVGALVAPMGSFRAGADSVVNSAYHGVEASDEASERFFRFFEDNGTDIQISGKAENAEILTCAQTLSDVFEIVPQEHLAVLKTLVLDFDPLAKRGLGGRSLIRIRCTDMTANELQSVFIHEIGHIVDTGLLDGHFKAGKSPFLDGLRPVFQDDPSIDFYQLSFSDSSSERKTVKPQDFVSGYAQSDVFEDFAESYTYYIVRGAEFRFLGRFYPVLGAKYAFLRDAVFDGREYGSEDEGIYEMADVNKRPFDVTKLDLLSS